MANKHTNKNVNFFIIFFLLGFILFVSFSMAKMRCKSEKKLKKKTNYKVFLFNAEKFKAKVQTSAYLGQNDNESVIHFDGKWHPQ
jgi:hypothetical protein